MRQAAIARLLLLPLLATCTAGGGEPTGLRATSLAVTVQPSNIAAGALMTPGVQVTARDAAGNKTTNFTGDVSLTLGTNRRSGKLYGTTTVIATGGVAVFSGLTVDSAAPGYTLRAVSPSLSGTASSPFDVAAAPSAVLIGAGDIASCPGGAQGATSALLQANPLATVFAAGDNAYPNGALTDYQGCYDAAWGQQKARTRPAAGNHEYQTAGAAGYWRYFGAMAGDSGKYYYSYDLGSWHIVVINSNDSDVLTESGSPQEAWLRADLKASAKQCTLAYWHHPRFSSGTTHGSSGWMQQVWQDLYDAGAEIVISGHEHNYERFAPQNDKGGLDPARGIREFVVGTGGASLYNKQAPTPNEEVFNGATWGVLKLTLYAASYTWEFVPTAGGSFTDTGAGSCH